MLPIFYGKLQLETEDDIYLGGVKTYKTPRAELAPFSSSQSSPEQPPKRRRSQFSCHKTQLTTCCRPLLILTFYSHDGLVVRGSQFFVGAAACRCFNSADPFSFRSCSCHLRLRVLTMRYHIDVYVRFYILIMVQVSLQCMPLNQSRKVLFSRQMGKNSTQMKIRSVLIVQFYRPGQANVQFSLCDTV